MYHLAGMCAFTLRRHKHIPCQVHRSNDTDPEQYHDPYRTTKGLRAEGTVAQKQRGGEGRNYSPTVDASTHFLYRLTLEMHEGDFQLNMAK